MKTCNKCKMAKNESEFYKLSIAKDGLNYRCKACILLDRQTDASKEYQAARRKTDAFKEYQRAYQQTKDYKEARKAYRKTDSYKSLQEEHRQTDARKKYMREYMKAYKLRQKNTAESMVAV